MNLILDTFSRELEAEYHEELLRTGNLNKKKENPWREETVFHSEGYLAKILRVTCQNCATQQDRLQGVFHREKNSLGSLRLIALTLSNQFPLIGHYPREIETTQVKICAECLPANFQ